MIILQNEKEFVFALEVTNWCLFILKHEGGDVAATWT